METLNGWTVLKREPHKFQLDVCVILSAIPRKNATPLFATHLKRNDGNVMFCGHYFNEDIAAAVKDLYDRAERRTA